MNARSLRLLALALLIALTASFGPAPGRTATAATKVHADKQAKKLVGNLAKASSPAQRRAALLKVMAAMRIGVYDSNTGKALVKGVESGKKDFYLYGYELTLLSGALERGELRPLSVPAQILTNVGIKPKGKPVDAAFLGRALKAAAKGALAHSTRNGEIVPLVIRELGLHHPHPYDLAKNVPLDTIQLDPLQTELLLASILGKEIHTASRGKSPRAAMMPFLSRPCKPINVVTSPFNPNTYLDFFGVHLHYVSDAALAGQISDFVQALTLAEKSVGAVNLAYTALSGLHGMLLAYSIKIESLPDMHPSTHYGPGGNDEADAGKPMLFRAKVTMQDSIPENIRTCINDAGFTVPPKGPVAGVEISWNVEGDLEQYGTVAYQPSDEKTGPDGIETMVFYPHNEKLPGFGSLYTKQGTATPRALWGQAFENLLATVNQVITPKLGEEYGWVVSFHKPRGFRFSNLKWSVHDNFGVGYPESTSSYDISGQVCGDDPNEIWTLTVHETDNWPVYGHYQYDGIREVSWIPGRDMVVGSNLGDEKIMASITPGLHPQLKVRVTTSGEQAGPRDQTVTADIIEDPSCPDNSDD